MRLPRLQPSAVRDATPMMRNRLAIHCNQPAWTLGNNKKKRPVTDGFAYYFIVPCDCEAPLCRRDQVLVASLFRSEKKIYQIIRAFYIAQNVYRQFVYI